MVDAHQFPGPALWQGLMLIVAALWGCWVFGGKDEDGRRTYRSDLEMRNSVALVFVIGLVLMLAILKWGGK